MNEYLITLETTSDNPLNTEDEHATVMGSTPLEALQNMLDQSAFKTTSTFEPLMGVHPKAPYDEQQIGYTVKATQKQWGIEYPFDLEAIVQQLVTPFPLLTEAKA